MDSVEAKGTLRINVSLYSALARKGCKVSGGRVWGAGGGGRVVGGCGSGGGGEGDDQIQIQIL